MRLILIFVILGTLSCTLSPSGNSSDWEKQKNNFKYRNKTKFIINEELRDDLKELKQVFLKLKPWIDTLYLYSWQGSDPTKIEFTVIGNEGMYGPSIFYVIFDKSDSLISSIRIAGSDDSGGSWSSFGSVFFSKDSFYMIDSKAEITHRPSTVRAIEKDGQISVIINVNSDSAVENIYQY